MAKNKDEKKTPFNVFSKKGFISMAIAGVMAVSPFMFVGCGETGPKGETGSAGKSAYELAVEQGFTGTLQDWLDSINGTTWLSGNGEPSSGLGNVGDFYMDEFNHMIYEKKSNIIFMFYRIIQEFIFP